MATTEKNRRKQLIVNKPAQLRAIGGVALYPSLGLAAATIVVAIFSYRLFVEADQAGVYLESLLPMFLAIVFFLAFTGVFLLYHSVILSHRVWGPAYRLCKSMERMRAGDLAFRIKLRDHDFLEDVGDEMNRLLDYLSANPPNGGLSGGQGPTAAAATVQSQPMEQIAGAPGKAQRSNHARKQRWIVAACAGAGAMALLLSGLVSMQETPAPVPLPEAPQILARSTADARVKLGRMLFFDPVLSGNETMACATCHDPDAGFADPRGISLGGDGEPLPRNTPTAANLIATNRLFLDGRAGSLEEQMLEHLLAKKEMGGSADRIVQRLSAIAAYRELFKTAFGDDAITLAGVTRAIAAYERTLLASDTPYDRWVRGDDDAMPPAARRGYEVFFGKAKCAGCHPPPYFGSDGVDPVGTPDRDASGKLVKGSDPGLAKVTGNPEHFGGFRAVSLRNLGATAPYMHNGVFRTLEEVIDFYDRGGARGLGLDVPNQDEEITPLGLTPAERSDLLAFLGALDQQQPLDTKPKNVPSGLPPGGKR